MIEDTTETNKPLDINPTKFRLGLEWGSNKENYDFMFLHALVSSKQCRLKEDPQ